MKTHLMQVDSDWVLDGPAPAQEDTLIADLELPILLSTMAQGDRFLYAVAQRALLDSLTDPEDIRYRQALLADCQNCPDVVRAIYAIALEALERERKDHWGGFPRYTGGILNRAVGVLKAFSVQLGALRAVAETQRSRFRSPGFVALFAMIQTELDDDYLATVDALLEALKFRRGILTAGQLGTGGKGTGYVLHDPAALSQGWLETLVKRQPLSFTFTLHPRDEAGARALTDLRDRGISAMANALAQSAAHIHDFFTMLRDELAFYIGCINLDTALTQLGARTCFPTPKPGADRGWVARELYDPTLALTLNAAPVGNDLDARGVRLTVITGSNQGGKSTFLRSVGIAQLMMQAGMFVPAAQFEAGVCRGLFTHYKREEDRSMESGKFDEELSRLSQIADWVTPGARVLFNESFASTNEREGCEIAFQIVTALLEADIDVVLVTHSFDLASRLKADMPVPSLFLRAQRQADGSRTFRLVPRAPERTSHGIDIYRKIFTPGHAGTSQE
jgi:hypothetical protein